GNIAYRWSATNPQPFSYKSPSFEELKAMDSNRLNELSPSEKFDIYNGNYRYLLTKKVLKSVSPKEEEWHGICHGYTAVSMNYPEPKTVELTNKDGISLKFYSSDVQALMSYFYAKVASARTRLVGSRCNSNPDRADETRNRSSCWDMNPGAFHIIVANRLGLQGKSFIADVNRFREILNHVAVSYESEILATGEAAEYSSPGTKSRALIETTIKYAGAISPKIDPVIGSPEAEYMDSRLRYWLDLDSNGKILGGEWNDGHQPDFVWIQDKVEFFGNWSKLSDIYQPVDM
ncbi:MAG: hypothetical protein K2P81_06850, partial [Bacteriovoracaceae bacterium]|nr:hypothetical protein [Bacteriovoracaceae bacterium]